MRHLKYLLLVAVCLSLALVMPRQASAITIDCPTTDTQENPVDSTPEDPIDIVGGCDSVASTLKYYLLQAGYDENAASGIMGNISAESCGYKVTVYKNCHTLAPDGFKAYIQGANGSYTLNPAMSRNDGFGLVQWTPDNSPSRDRLLRLQKYADSLDKAITDLDVQIGYLLAELTTNKYGTYYSRYLAPDKFNGKSLEATTWAILKYFEAPASVRGSPGMSQVNKVCEDASSSWCKSFRKRLERAQEAKKISGNCNPSGSSTDDPDDTSDPDDGGSDDDSGSDTPTPVTVVTPTDEPGPTTTGGTSGALGARSSNNMVGQYDNGIKDVVWRTDGSTVSASGCSLVAVVNAARATGRSQSSVNVSNLASWSKTNISAASWDGLKRMASHVGMTTSSWLWSSKSTSESAKIQKIRDTLASGGAVIAGGDRAGTDSSFCTTARKANGDCVFTPGGHFVAIIGITADNKLVVANPGKANNRTWIFPASNVLQYSNKAIMVK